MSAMTAARVAAPSGAKAAGSRLLQRKCGCRARASSAAGECPECERKKRLQRKLAIGAANDPLEKEADRIADHVVAGRSHDPRVAAPLRIQRFTAQPDGIAASAPAGVDRALARPGVPLEPSLRHTMEERLGYDFSQVRVHADAQSAASARQIYAHAYTSGNHIVFGAGRYAPATLEGRRLLAHELTHVVQQTGVRAAIQRDGSGSNEAPNAAELVKNVLTGKCGTTISRESPTGS